MNDPFEGLDPLVAEHMRKKMLGVETAQNQMDQANMASGVAGIADVVANSMNKPVILENSMQNLGAAPKMIEARQQKTDLSGLQNSAARGLKTATQDRDQAIQQALQAKKDELLRQIQEKKAAQDQTNFEANYAQKDREIAALAANRKIANSIDQQKLDLERQKVGTGQGKAIPAELASKISGYDAATTLIDELEKSYQDNASGKGSWIKGMIPGTDANAYAAGLKPKVQALGTALEGGKLTDADFAKYYDMIPSSSDFPDQAAAKIKSLREALKAKRDAELGLLKSSGYNTPQATASVAPSTPPNANNNKPDWAK